jgi:16S rRNA (guanine527-N7)-methyltransferase
VNATEFADRFDVSRETLDRLSAYEALLKKWNRAINLVARPTLTEIWSRHFADSAQLLPLIPNHARSWIDLGSGAGFPGLVIAILRPDIAVTVVESDKRKCVFLKEVARETGTDVAVVNARIETLDMQADVVSARALASLSDLLALARPCLAPNGHAVFLKGENVEQELTEANRLWHIELTKHDSLADPRGSILSITDFHRRPDP